MKKNISIILLALLAAALPAAAQYHGHYPRAYLEGRKSYGGGGWRQAGYIPAYLGMRVGVTGAAVNSDDGRLDGGTLLSGLNIGLVTGARLLPFTPLIFETGLTYIEKGGKGTYEGKKFTYGLNYLEAPLLLKYKIPVSPDLTIQPFSGGYLSLGVGGKIKDYGEREAYSAFSDDNFKRLDGGLRVGCGAQLNILYLELGYDIGLANVSGDEFDESHTGALFANIGVNF